MNKLLIIYGLKFLIYRICLRYDTMAMIHLFAVKNVYETPQIRTKIIKKLGNIFFSYDFID